MANYNCLVSSEKYLNTLYHKNLRIVRFKYKSLGVKLWNKKQLF